MCCVLTASGYIGQPRLIYDRILPEVERLLYWLGNALSPFELDLQQESPSINQPEVPQSQLMPPPVHEPEHQERHKAIEGS